MNRGRHRDGRRFFGLFFRDRWRLDLDADQLVSSRALIIRQSRLQPDDKIIYRSRSFFGFRTRFHVQRICKICQQVNTFEKQINLLAPQLDARLLSGNKYVFHDMSEDYTQFYVNNAGSAFERMGGAHTNFELLRCRRCAFQHEKSARQGLRLTFRFDAKEVMH